MKYADLCTYYQQMISIRHEHKGFRLGTAELVDQHCELLPVNNAHLIIYRIKDLEGIDSAKSLLVFLNGGPQPAQAEIPESSYTVLAHDAQADVFGLGEIKGGKIVVEPYSATILAEK